MRTGSFKALTSAVLALFGVGAAAAEKTQEQSWQETYDARQKYFEGTVGPLSNDILKMLNTSGVWPGGGLYAIPAPKMGSGMAVYTTFGFTNPDMPTSVRMTDFKLSSEGNRTTKAEGRLEAKPRAPQRPGAAGYGYEIIVVAPAGLDWPLNLLQWAVNAELMNDVGFLDRVEKYGGLTVEQVDAGASEPLNILVSKALPPLPVGTQLPAGKMEILVITTITSAEMQWSMKNGRDHLLQRLREAGVGQISNVGREGVVR
ncbi:suppressor of fused domain protein [Roseateles chitinivorans]|uniref:suppressor of fused domain protein n=1 Tax=Roseateles chitinivorans TaxID=2917965 RepID=UPI003D667BE1